MHTYILAYIRTYIPVLLSAVGVASLLELTGHEV